MSQRPRPSAAILITGSELLLGLVADRNTSFLARTLDRLGLPLYDIFTARATDEGREDDVRVSYDCGR